MVSRPRHHVAVHPPLIIEQVQHASMEELDRWAERVLSAVKLDDVLRR